MHHEVGQVCGAQHPEPQAATSAEMGRLIGVGHWSAADRVPDMLMKGLEPFGHGFLSLTDGADAEPQTPLHRHQILDVAGAHPVVSAHQSDPGDQPGAHLTGWNLLRELGGGRPAAAGADPGEALVFGDGIDDLWKIKDLVAGLGIRMDFNLSATRAEGIGKVTLDFVNLGLRDLRAHIPSVALLGPFLFAGGFLFASPVPFA